MWGYRFHTDIHQYRVNCGKISPRPGGGGAGFRGAKRGKGEGGGLDFGEVREAERLARARGLFALRGEQCKQWPRGRGRRGRVRWDPAYAVNTITLWTRLPFKWKQTWNAKIHRRVPLPPPLAGRPLSAGENVEAARTALECSIIGMQMACAEPACISRARRDILRGGGFWMAGGRGFFFACVSFWYTLRPFIPCSWEGFLDSFDFLFFFLERLHWLFIHRFKSFLIFNYGSKIIVLES